MGETIKLEICVGTTCYMLGAGDLMRMVNELPEAWQPWVEISAVPCLEVCTRRDLGGAPFVKIDGDMIGNATRGRVMSELRDRLHEKGVDDE